METHTETLTTTVVTAIADELGASPTELKPLYSVVDTDALDRLFRPGTRGSITFDYYGCTITVDHDGAVEVAPNDA